MFCPKCGSILMPKNSDGKKVMLCSCGFTDKNMESAKIKEKIKSEKKIDVVENEKESLPLTDAECPKCKHKKAYYWMVQTRAGDEPETKFLKCEACKHIWRDYG